MSGSLYKEPSVLTPGLIDMINEIQPPPRRLLERPRCAGCGHHIGLNVAYREVGPKGHKAKYHVECTPK